MKLNSPLKSLNIRGLAKKFNFYNYGCDYLRLSYNNLTEYIDNLKNVIDCDNSNYIVIEIGGVDFTIQKIPTTIGIGLNATIDYNGVSVPCFQFVIFDENTHHLTRKYGKLDFYGSFFRLIEIGFISSNIIKDICCSISDENPRVTRYDFKIDFFGKKELKLPTLKQTFNYIHSQSSFLSWKKGYDITDWLLGSKKSGIYAVRFYDKLIDSDKKGKCFLYSDYFEFESVHRLEFEFQRNFLKGYYLNDFFSGKINLFIIDLLGINGFTTCSHLYTTYEKDLPLKGIYRTKYIKRYNTMTSRLSKNGINPYIQVYHELSNYNKEYSDKLINDFLNLYFEEEKRLLTQKFNL